MATGEYKIVETVSKMTSMASLTFFVTYVTKEGSRLSSHAST